MKLIIILALALVAVVVAAPAEEKIPQTLSSTFTKNEEGYDSSFETDNGIRRIESGRVKEFIDEEKNPKKVVVVKGSYAYTDKEGKEEVVNYYADETGYHADGPSIPKNTR